ncbi:MAG: hypothetical protein A2W31_14870 [Planctomycetes bacterium RBG_16_64_10]|nr:MAG: hypothetical protein A2W31_14870 [Planctomycetes bacterium RBG_16_64_10]
MNVRDAMAYLELLWSTYVVGLNHQKQQNSIYAPVANAVVDAFRGVFDPRAWRRRAAGLARLARDGLWSWLAGNWFSWRGGLAAMVFCLALVGLFHALRAIGRRLRRRFARRHQPGRDHTTLGVRFYHRLETLFGRHGVTRAAGATQREFATAAAGHLVRLPAGQPLASLPRQIADAFYRVRFGQQQLDKDETEAVERALIALEAALRATGPSRPQARS